MNREEVLKQAILNEVEGYEFYKMFAKQANNVEIKELFMLTANEELSHTDYLKSLMDGKVPDNFADLKDLDVPSPSVFKNPKLNPGEINSTIAAFSIGVNMEEKASAFYREHASKTDDENVKALFTKLAQWEETHRDQFKSHHESLLESWWDENNFAPF